VVSDRRRRPIYVRAAEVAAVRNSMYSTAIILKSNGVVYCEEEVEDVIQKIMAVKGEAKTASLPRGAPTRRRR
jgi:hypothetical protein